MGFHLTSPAPEKGDPTAEKRVWGFFGDAQERPRGNCPQPKQPRQGNHLNTTKTALGRAYWPSRDPIGEKGGFNLYGMVRNNVVGRVDILGQKGWSDAWGDFGDWGSGEHDSETYHDHNDKRTQNLRDSNSVDKLRNFLKDKNKNKCRGWEGVTNYAEDFKPWDWNFWTDLGNGSQHFVGSWSAEVKVIREWTTHNGNERFSTESDFVTVEFRLTNTTTYASFFRFVPWVDDSDNVIDDKRDDGIPGLPGVLFLDMYSNWKQTFVWQETHNTCNRYKKKYTDCTSGKDPDSGERDPIWDIYPYIK